MSFYIHGCNWSYEVVFALPRKLWELSKFQLSIFRFINYLIRKKQRCLNTNTLGIVIHQLEYPTQVVSTIKSITDVVPVCQCSTLSTPLLEKLGWFGLAYPSRYATQRMIFPTANHRWKNDTGRKITFYSSFHCTCRKSKSLPLSITTESISCIGRFSSIFNNSFFHRKRC